MWVPTCRWIFNLKVRRRVVRVVEIILSHTHCSSNAGTTEIHKLIGRERLSFKVLRLRMGRRDAKQIVGEERVLPLAALFRAHGPRLQNCRKNIHKAKYSLKLPARLALPFAYKPPKGSYGDGEA